MSPSFRNRKTLRTARANHAASHSYDVSEYKHLHNTGKQLTEYREFQNKRQKLDPGSIGVDGIENPVSSTGYNGFDTAMAALGAASAEPGVGDEDTESTEEDVETTLSEVDDGTKSGTPRAAESGDEDSEGLGAAEARNSVPTESGANGIVMKSSSKKRKRVDSKKRGERKETRNEEVLENAEKVSEKQLVQPRKSRSYKVAHEELISRLQQFLEESPRRECIKLAQELLMKYRGQYDTSWWKISGPGIKHPHFREEYLERTEGAEEDRRPWMKPAAKMKDTPSMLFRGWDERSQCRINDPAVGFSSGGSANKLNTFENRQLALGQHANWGNRTKTPFISFTSSIQQIEQKLVPCFQKRQLKKRVVDYTRITIINTKARIANGRPILRMKDELQHYNVKDRAGFPIHGTPFFENEYIIPFSIPPDEIMGTWAWRDIEEWMTGNKSTFEDWCSQVANPAYEKHEEARLKDEEEKNKRVDKKRNEIAQRKLEKDRAKRNAEVEGALVEHDDLVEKDDLPEPDEPVEQEDEVEQFEEF